MRTVLVTGFGAFPGAHSNPSAEVVKALLRFSARRFQRAGWRLTGTILPVIHTLAPVMDALIVGEKPDAIIHFGLNARKKAVCVETRAKNYITMLVPDAQKQCATSPALSTRKNAFLPVRWQIRPLRAAITAQGFRVSLSQDAGDYICNALLWRTLETTDIPCVFIHVPGKRHAAPPALAEALARLLPGLLSRQDRHISRHTGSDG